MPHLRIQIIVRICLIQAKANPEKSVVSFVLTESIQDYFVATTWLRLHLHLTLGIQT